MRPSEEGSGILRLDIDDDEKVDGTAARDRRRGRSVAEIRELRD
jgi:hypothetical protein